MPISEWVKAVREIVGHDLVVMVGAAAIVLDGKGNILLQQRADNGMWGVPGGSIEPGEEPAQAAIRETYEETGLHVEVVRLVGVFGSQQQVRQYPDGDQFAYVSITFECRVTGGEIIPDPEESLDVRWFSLDDLPPSFVDVHHRRIQAIKNGSTPYFKMPPEIIPQSVKTNYIHSIREKIGNLLVMSPGSTTLIFDDAGRLLVQRRRDDGCWNLPGGLYEIGEEPAETGIREAYEETGLLVKPVRLVGVYGGEAFRHCYPNGDESAYIAIVFACEIIGGELNTNNNETLELRFVAPDDLPEPFMDRHRLLVDHALNRTEPYFAV